MGLVYFDAVREQNAFILCSETGQERESFASCIRAYKLLFKCELYSLLINHGCEIPKQKM